MQKILTIGIPTYNRAGVLRSMLCQLREDIAGFEDKIEIIISDNCSTDSTPLIIDEWVRNITPNLKVRHTRNPSNIGVSRNIVSLFYMAEAQYFMFLGDDDRLNRGKLSKLFEILESKQVSAVIAPFGEGASPFSGTGEVEIERAADFFYKYGNAWMSIIDANAAKRAVDQRNLRTVVEGIVWPQTVMGFLAICDVFPERRPYVADFELGKVLSPDLNITNASYWVRSLTDLLQAAKIVDQESSKKIFKKKLMFGKRSGFLSHVKAIFWHSLIDSNSRTDCRELIAVLRANYGLPGVFCGWGIATCRYPNFIEILYHAFNVIIRKMSYRNSNEKLAQSREVFQNKIKMTNETKRRYEDWF